MRLIRLLFLLYNTVNYKVIQTTVQKNFVAPIAVDGADAGGVDATPLCYFCRSFCPDGLFTCG